MAPHSAPRATADTWGARRARARVTPRRPRPGRAAGLTRASVVHRPADWRRAGGRPLPPSSRSPRRDRGPAPPGTPRAGPTRRRAPRVRPRGDRPRIAAWRPGGRLAARLLPGALAEP